MAEREKVIFELEALEASEVYLAGDHLYRMDYRHHPLVL